MIRAVRTVVAGVLAVLGTVAAWRVLGLRRLEVAGESMLPTLVPGDRLLVVRARRVQAGDLVAVCDPRCPERLLVKRVVATGGGQVELRGDNPAASTDSRDFGAVPVADVAGRVLRRYAPAGRAGPVH